MWRAYGVLFLSKVLWLKSCTGCRARCCTGCLHSHAGFFDIVQVQHELAPAHCVFNISAHTAQAVVCTQFIIMPAQVIAGTVERKWVESGDATYRGAGTPGFAFLQKVFMGGALATSRAEYVHALQAALPAPERPQAQHASSRRTSSVGAESFAMARGVQPAPQPHAAGSGAARAAPAQAEAAAAPTNAAAAAAAAAPQAASSHVSVAQDMPQQVRPSPVQHGALHGASTSAQAGGAAAPSGAVAHMREGTPLPRSDVAGAPGSVGAGGASTS